MKQVIINQGVVHRVSKDMKDLFMNNERLLELWNAITPLARNEWICWITSAKKDETRIRRMRIMSENLPKRKNRPCCWAGCVHR